ncbi:MAG: DUF4421 domain-containing protein [Bacteroidaceae bacterium]|nr:DUF4421 domain-containing protein [Bacteroidaceae bacterium]
MKYSTTYNLFLLKMLTAAIFMLSATEVLSQNIIPFDSLGILKYPGYIFDYTQKKIESTNKVIYKHLDEKDTHYITPNLYKWTFMAQYSNCYEYYKFSAKNSSQSISLSPDTRNKLGFYVGWRWIFLGWSFDLDRQNTKNDWNFSFYTSKVGIDIFHRKTGDNFRIRKLTGFNDPVSGAEIEPYGQLFDGVSVEQSGINLYYIFNNKKFSYPAAYSQSTNQRISCGSFLLGFSYSRQSFHLDASRFDSNIKAAMHPSMNFNRIKYHDYSISAGYSYNWVFAKNCLANISLTPAIGYKRSRINTDEDRSIFKNINADLISRAAIVYNNSRFFVGASLVSHTYTYHRSTISIVNGFGVVNIYSGINLFRK